MAMPAAYQGMRYYRCCLNCLSRKRVMYTAHHPCWDAKNRHDLPEELPLDYAAIAQCIPGDASPAPAAVPVPVEVPAPPREPPRPTPRQEEKREEKQPRQASPSGPAPEAPPAPPAEPAPAGVPPRVQVLMDSGGITEQELRDVIAWKGYFTTDTPWSVMEDIGFVDGWILPFWPTILEMASAMRSGEDLSRFQ